jgi:hypothetical protein
MPRTFATKVVPTKLFTGVERPRQPLQLEKPPRQLMDRQHQQLQLEQQQLQKQLQEQQRGQPRFPK